MKKTFTDTFGKTETYEIVDKIPAGFFVWNIGANMGSVEYIPLVESAEPNNKACFDINPITKKAIRLDPSDAEKLRAAAGYGVNSLETARKAIKSKRGGSMAERKKAHALATLAIFEKITA